MVGVVDGQQERAARLVQAVAVGEHLVILAQAQRVVRARADEAERGESAGVEFAADARPLAAGRLPQQGVVAGRHPLVVAQRPPRQVEAVEQAADEVAEQG